MTPPNNETFNQQKQFSDEGIYFLIVINILCLSLSCEKMLSPKLCFLT